MELTLDRINEISEIVNGDCRVNAELRSRSTFRIGGPADLLVAPQNKDQLARLIRYLNREQIRKVFIGGGSNCLFMDKGFRGVVIRLTGIRYWEIFENGSDKVTLKASCGMMLPTLVKMTCRQGYCGLEGLWGIPGAFGGAIKMNAGTGEMTVGGLIKEITILDHEGYEKTIGPDIFKPKYREIFLPEGSVALEAKLVLERRDRDLLKKEMDRQKTSRRASQPLGFPSAGCVFRNPAHDQPAGMLIDRLGMKGLTVGDAMVSPKHANFIVNKGRASSAHVLELIGIIQDRVAQEYGLDLELEVKIIDSHDRD